MRSLSKTPPRERLKAYDARRAELDAEEARLLEITMAPTRLQEVRSEKLLLESAITRAQHEALADDATGGKWRITFAESEAAAKEADAEAALRDNAAAVKARVEVVPEGQQLGNGRIGHIGPGLAGLIPPESADPERALAHMKRRIAHARLRRVASFPERLAQARPEAQR